MCRLTVGNAPVIRKALLIELIEKPNDFVKI